MEHSRNSMAGPKDVNCSLVIVYCISHLTPFSLSFPSCVSSFLVPYQVSQSASQQVSKSANHQISEFEDCKSRVTGYTSRFTHHSSLITRHASRVLNIKSQEMSSNSNSWTYGRSLTLLEWWHW